MNYPAISARGISKRYKIGARQNRHLTLRGEITEGMAKFFHRIKTRSSKPQDSERTFWALKDVSFDVQPGEVVGVIGRNGAGKSTLLKILSEITYPTEGRVELRGRVGSLLEVGTGFHPELTGRENIYLNGAILGMKRAEINRKFDEIAAFAEVDQFLDTPVKRYSSGMYVRLAFAVAAHLEPEILLVDEVLAVGDIAFQRKCIGKMSDVAKSGRTILFVSHNMAAVDALCSKTILLEKGKVFAIGATADVIQQYVRGLSEIPAEMDLSDHPARTSGSTAILKSWKMLNAGGEAVPAISLGEDITLEVSGTTPKLIPGASLMIQINRPSGERIVTCYTDYQYNQRIALNGPFTFRCTIRDCRLMPGPYVIHLSLKSTQEVVDNLENLPCEVTPRDIYGTGKMLPPRCGPYLPDVKWEVIGGTAR